MKILHIINTLEIGGAQSVLIQLLEGWGDGRDHQMVISLMDRGQLAGQIEALNIPVKHINLRPGKVQPGKFLQLVKIIKAYQPDVVQTWLYHADLIGGIAARMASRVPIVWGVHHTTTGRSSVKSSTWFVIRILSLLSKSMPAHIICCSQSAHNTHLDFGYPRNKTSMIPNGVDTERFQPDPHAPGLIQGELGLSTQTRMIGMFARFHPQKDHVTLIRAAGLFLKKKPDVHFVLAGEGVDLTNRLLQDTIAREGVRDNFHLLGIRRDMPRLTAGMDIVTSSSSYGEALPMTLCEAMSCGIPCVATNIGDTAVLIGDSGLIVEPQDPAALAQAWQTVLDLPAMKYGQLSNRARKRVLEFHNRARMVAEYKAVYKGLKEPS